MSKGSLTVNDNWKGFGRSRSWGNGGTIPALHRKHVRITGVPAEIRTGHVPNTNMKLPLNQTARHSNEQFKIPCKLSPKS